MALPEQYKQTPEDTGAHPVKWVDAVCRTCGKAFKQNATAPTMSCPECMSDKLAAFWALFKTAT